MTNEVVLKSGRKFAMGSEWWDLEDKTTAVEFVDLITEMRHVNGVFYLSFAASVLDAGGEGVVRVSSRLRMNLSTGQFLHKLLGDMISDALNPVDKAKTN